MFRRTAPPPHRATVNGSLTTSALFGATWPLLLGAVVLMGLAQMAHKFAGAARATAIVESAWSRARSGAVASLTLYALRGDDAEFRRYQEQLDVIQSMRRARQAVSGPQDDVATAVAEMRRAGISDQDVDNLAFAHRWLIRSAPFAIRLATFHTLDENIDALDRLAHSLHDAGTLRTKQQATDALARIQVIDAALKENEDYFMTVLAQQARWVNRASTVVDIGAAMLLVLAGTLATRRALARMAHTEASLRRANERLDLANAGANEGVWDWNVQTMDFYWSPRLQAMLGYASREDFERDYGGVRSAHPDDRDRLRVALRDHLERRSPKLDIEYRVLCADGAYKWVQVRGQCVWDAAGQPLRVVGTMSDITDRKEAERLREHTVQMQLQAAENLDNALTGARAAHWAFAPKTGTVLHAHHWKELLGRDTMPDTFDEWMQLIHPNDRESRLFVLRQHLNNHTSHAESEFRMRHADGRWIQVRSYGRVLSRDASGAALYFAAVVMDISNQVNVRRLEQDQYRFLQAIVNSVDTGVLVANARSISFINAPLRRALGYGPHDSLHGMRLDDLIAECDRSEAAQRQAKALAGIPLPPRVMTLMSRDGASVRMLFNTSSFTWNDVPHIIASATPASETDALGMRIDEVQRRFDSVLLSELEQQQAHIARELHDSLGSVLAGASLILGSARQLVARETAGPLIDRAITQVTRAAEMSRALSHGLMPVGESSGGVAGALEQLAHDMSLVKGLHCEISIESSASEIDADTGTHVFRVAQEAINNATRHGKASQIDIALTLEDDHYLLSIEDNGTGFDVDTVPVVRPGIGLQSMMARAKAIRGSVEFHRAPGGGCTVVLAWPRHAQDPTLT